MLVLLAATRIPALHQLLPNDLLAAGSHLQQLLTTWQRLNGEPSSPSSRQALSIICEAHHLILQHGVSSD